MNVLDEDIRRKVVQWLAYGDDDLRLARHGLTLSSGCPYRLIAYHAQQCAEKHLKAYLVFHRIDFPYTHNIARLVELCAERVDWAEVLREAEELTPFAITARYPGEDKAVTKREALRAIDLAALVRRAVRTALTQEDMILPEDTEV
jgi:HEPN domain-containing protein